MRNTVLIACCAILAGCSREEQEQPAEAHPMNGTLNPVVAEYPDAYRPFIENSYEDPESMRGRLPFERISLRREPCYGPCPVYEVILHRDGRAEFRAEKNMPETGNFEGEVHLGSYARLCFLIEKSNFKDLKADYRAGWTDDATCIVTVVSGNTPKSVSEYGGVGPIDLWAIQQSIDAIRSNTRWRRAE